MRYSTAEILLFLHFDMTDQNNNWCGEQDEILIDFVRNHEPLFNVKSAEYRKMELKQKLWHEVGTILGKTGWYWWLLFITMLHITMEKYTFISMFSIVTILPFNSAKSVEIMLE